MTLWGAIAALQLEIARLAEELGKLKGQVGSEALDVSIAETCNGKFMRNSYYDDFDLYESNCGQFLGCMKPGCPASLKEIVEKASDRFKAKPIYRASIETRKELEDVSLEAQGKEKPAPTSCEDGHLVGCECWWDY